MRRNLAHFCDGFEVGLLILNELNGENQAKHPQFFYLIISEKAAELAELAELGVRGRRPGGLPFWDAGWPLAATPPPVQPGRSPAVQKRRRWFRDTGSGFSYNFKDSEWREIIGKLGEEMLRSLLNGLRRKGTRTGLDNGRRRHLVQRNRTEAV
jgi:hypothetical protein